MDQELRKAWAKFRDGIESGEVPEIADEKLRDILKLAEFAVENRTTLFAILGFVQDNDEIFDAAPGDNCLKSVHRFLVETVSRERAKSPKTYTTYYVLVGDIEYQSMTGQTIFNSVSGELSISHFGKAREKASKLHEAIEQKRERIEVGITNNKPFRWSTFALTEVGTDENTLEEQEQG